MRDGTHDTPKYIGSGYPLITSKNLTSSGTINFDDISYISEDDFNFINKRSNVDTNDILFGMIGTIGNPVLVGNDANFAIKNVALIKKSDSINQYFLINILNSNIFKKYIIKTNQGNTQKFISLSQIRKFTFYAPQLYEQIEIGKILQKIDSVITLYENKRKLLTALSQGLSQYLFNFSKEKNAIQMSLSSITVSETKGIAKENTLSLGNIEYLDTTRLNGGKAKLVSGKKDVDFRDIIVLWDGSNAGKIYYGFSGILGSTLKVFKLKDDINSEYVFYYLKSKQNLILHKFRTPNIPHVSKDFSQRFNLPIPDKEKQNLIANILHLNELQINLINKKIEKLKQIKESLLQNMFL